MPEAIATSKRRFNRALDSITSPLQTSLVPSSSTSSLSVKRSATAAEAFDEARERAKKRLRHSVSSSSVTSVPPLKVPAAPRLSTRNRQASSKQDLPNFAPWSHEQFLSRLATFSSVSLWHPKPEAIGEVEWAKRGWTCVGLNTVGCRGGCEKRVVVDLDLPARANLAEQSEDEDDENSDSALEQALSERYKGMIVDAHSVGCLWRKSGCKDDIYHLQVIRPAVWQPELRRRYRSVMSVRDGVKSAVLKGLEDFIETTNSYYELLKSLPRPLLDDTEDSEDPSAPKALAAALHGWCGFEESGSELLRCEACFQRIGLWMYQPDYKSAMTVLDEEDEATGPAIVNLIELHREHCPWRHATSQKAPGSLAGLNATQILYRVISACAREHRRRSNEQTTSMADAGTLDTAEDERASIDAVLSREEVQKQDKERESKLKRLKSLFSIKRRSAKIVVKEAPASSYSIE